MTNDPTSAAYEELEKKIYDKFYYGCSMADAEAYTRETMQLFKQAIAEAETRGRNSAEDDITEACKCGHNNHTRFIDTQCQSCSCQMFEPLQANADGANGRDGEVVSHE